MPAANYDIETYRREYYEETLTFTDSESGAAIDFDGSTAVAHVRRADNSNNADAPAPLLNLNATVVGVGSTGQITLAADIDEMAADTYEWDLFVVFPGNKPKKMLAGKFSVAPSTTGPV
jgi:hypothetical protein